MVNNLEQKPEKHYKEDHIDTVNINFINFNSKHLLITEKLKASLNQVKVVVTYKVHTGSD